jgi:hypothetical protein
LPTKPAGVLALYFYFCMSLLIGAVVVYQPVAQVAGFLQG